MPITVRRIRPDEARTLKRTRLALLADSPSAFGSTLERELAFPDEVWAERATGSSAGVHRATFLAFDGDTVVGIVGALRAPVASDTIELVSMWITPAARRSGLGRLLVDTVLAWAGDAGARSIELWVTRGNDAALHLYESTGFAVTGDHQPLPSDPCRDEIRMRRALDGR